MSKKAKKVRERGKIRLSQYFQRFNSGDSVAVVREKSVSKSFPERLQGKTGVVENRRGNSYMVKIKDINEEKRFLIQPVHLKRIKLQVASLK